jgi:predicted RNA-binding protein with RPS1 domain
METTFQLHVSELNSDFIDIIKKLFKDKPISITVSETDEWDLYAQETPEAYKSRLQKAIEQVKNGKYQSFTEEEFEQLSDNLLQK